MIVTVTVSDDKGKPIHLDDLNTWMSEEPDIGRISARTSTSLVGKHGANYDTVTVYGITPSYYDIQGLQLSMGRWLKTADQDNRTYVCVLNDTAAKELIAERAASLVFDGATLILDASSTARRMLHYLNHRHDLKIITNNLQLFNEIGNCDAQLYCTGGTYIRENHAFTGALAESFIRKVSADFLFFSSQGISEDGEITDASEEETSLRRAMMSRAEHTYFLCDASKIGQRRLFTLCHKEELTGILCDAPLPWEENP